LSTRRKNLPQFNKRHYKLLQNRDREALFQSDRENDQLMEALGNPEHRRHIHSVGSLMPWKHGFLKDNTSY
jgi:hypothetical protein